MTYSKNACNRLVSVIIPTHNRPKLLRKAVLSVIKQSYRPIEIFIIDDCSDQIIELSLFHFELKDIDIQIHRNKRCKGVSASRNIGIKKSNGFYVSFLDDDDSWLPEKLESQIKSLEANKTSLIQGVYCQMIIEDENANEISRTNFPGSRKAIIDRIIYRDGNIPPQTLLVNKNIFDVIGYFNEKLPSFEDREWALRYLSNFDILLIDDYLVRYLEHTGQRLTTSSYSMLQGELLFTQIIKETLINASTKTWRKALGYRHTKLGNEYMLNDNYFLGLKSYLYAIYLYPFEFRALAGFLLGLGGAKLYKKIVALRMSRVRLTVNNNK